MEASQGKFKSGSNMVLNSYSKTKSQKITAYITHHYHHPLLAQKYIAAPSLEPLYGQTTFLQAREALLCLP